MDGTGYIAAEPIYRAAIVGCLAAARGLGECLARRREFDAARDAHDLWLRQWLQSDQSADVRRRQTAAKARHVPPMAFVAMQKSASEYIRANLMSALDVPEISVSIGTVPVDVAIPSALHQLAQGGAFCRTHASSDIALALADAGLDRMLLHVRDPRQVTISWAHMMQRVTTQEAVYAAHLYDPPIPDAYRSWTFDRQLAWAIENYLPGQLNWLHSWAEVLDGNPPLRIGITTFEQFREDEAAFFQHVLAFFEAPPVTPAAFNIRNAAAMRNFRSGSVSEWERFFTLNQKRALEPRLAPLAKRFGWAL
jgi:hypothetical protein